MIFGGLLDYDLNAAFYYIVNLLSFTSLIAIYAISYFTLKHLDVVSSGFQKKKYSGSKLDAKKEPEYYQKVIEITETEQSYLNPDYTINDLAARLSINSKYLSQIINKHIEGGFIQLINKYRIEAVKKSLNDPANNHLTIYAIAESCGFTSKSTFTRVFRTHVGMLPKEYKEQMQPS